MWKVFSAGWVVYYIDKKTNIPHFLMVKRFALSKKIERIAPKWKIQKWETQEKAAIREISEEAGLPEDTLVARKKLETLSLKLTNHDWKIWIDKDITYFLIEYSWDPDSVQVIEWEWFTWVYKRAQIRNVLNLVTYRDLRELYRIAYVCIWDLSVKDKFLESL